MLLVLIKFYLGYPLVTHNPPTLTAKIESIAAQNNDYGGWWQMSSKTHLE